MSQEEDKSESSDFKPLKPYWNCTVCTFENKSESFKCKMCHVRRGSSSRQSSINPLLATQQYRPAAHLNQKKHHLVKQREPGGKGKRQGVKMGRAGKRRQAHAAKISNIDRKSGRSLAITVNNVTVTFTEYKLKPKKTNPNKKNKKNALDFLPQCLVASEIDSSSKSSFTSQSESLQSYTDGISNDKMESNGIDQ
ncbi:YY1-associated factor 2-like [Homalodisca vitripennis]|uniref:RanBP2-type domain-containing protein n=2 Tax=Proconiini TaxID=565685 RepID=A0A1B6GWR4_9HEMI|nr:YY1-associated factor 2-like [Homalodisca vitripennis]KAG8271134.1 YY1-associated factor 2 [Homalodisca vitripennis]